MLNPVSFLQDTLHNMPLGNRNCFHISLWNNQTDLWIVLVQIQLLSFECLYAAECYSLSNLYLRTL